MDPNKYDRFSDFLKDLRAEIGISGTEIARQLDLSHSSISQYEKNKKNPSKKVVGKLIEVYKLNLDSCLRLRERSINEKKKTNTNSELKVKEKEKPKEQFSATEEQGKIPPQQINESTFEDSSPELLELFETLLNLSDELQQELVPEVHEIIELRRFNSIQKYLYKDVKSIITKTYDNWKKSVAGPGYKKEEKSKFKEEMEGLLELSNASLFFSLTSDEQLLQMKTRYQDRHLIEDLLKLISGVKVSEFTYGSLAKAYKKTPLYCVFVYNPASLVKDMKRMFMERDIQVNKVTFEECIIKPYFKN